jgi:hypothetical protein
MLLCTPICVCAHIYPLFCTYTFKDVKMRTLLVSMFCIQECTHTRYAYGHMHMLARQYETARIQGPSRVYATKPGSYGTFLHHVLMNCCFHCVTAIEVLQMTAAHFLMLATAEIPTSVLPAPHGSTMKPDLRACAPPTCQLVCPHTCHANLHDSYHTCIIMCKLFPYPTSFIHAVQLAPNNTSHKHQGVSYAWETPLRFFHQTTNNEWNGAIPQFATEHKNSGLGTSVLFSRDSSLEASSSLG